MSSNYNVCFVASKDDGIAVIDGVTPSLGSLKQQQKLGLALIVQTPPSTNALGLRAVWSARPFASTPSMRASPLQKKRCVWNFPQGSISASRAGTTAPVWFISHRWDSFATSHFRVRRSPCWCQSTLLNGMQSLQDAASPSFGKRVCIRDTSSPSLETSSPFHLQLKRLR